MKELFVLSDVHGKYDLFCTLLKQVSFATQQLLLLGDLCDRGEKSKQCLLKAMQLTQTQGAIYLRGNHEQLFLDFLENPETKITSYVENGGRETLESFFFPNVLEEYSPTEMALMIKSRHKDLIAFLSTLPYFTEWEQYLFVHAGVNLLEKDWHKTSKEDFLEIREAFFRYKNHTGKTIVFGHTPTCLLHGAPQNFAIWQQDNKIGIDGGAVFGGQLNGVVLSKNGLQTVFDVHDT